MSADKNTVMTYLKDNVAAVIPKTLNAKYGGVVVYLRAGVYHYDSEVGSRTPAIGVVNVQLDEDHAEGTGHFKGFITELEATGRELGYRFIRIEQVQSQHLLQLLERNNYIKSNSFDDVLVKKL